MNAFAGDAQFRQWEGTREQWCAASRPMMRSLERRRLQCYIALMAGDLVALILGSAICGWLSGRSLGAIVSLEHVKLVGSIAVIFGLYHGAYSLTAIERPLYGAGRALSSLLTAMLVVLFVIYCTQSSATALEFKLVETIFFGAVALTAIRWQMRHVVRWVCGDVLVNALVIDDGGPLVTVPGAYHLSAEQLNLSPSLDNPRKLNRVGLVMRNADRVVVSTLPERRSDWATVLRGANVAGEILDEVVAGISSISVNPTGTPGLLQVSVAPLGIRDRGTKRLFDLLFAGTMLLCLAPLMVLIAIAIKLEDGGPVFFYQRRLGRCNRFFAIWKFRSMSPNKEGRSGNTSASRDDKRITRIGSLLRKTSIDELPQLFNVLLGDMSLVGPRPHAIGSQAGGKLFWEVDARYWERHSLKPGLTGLAQVRGWRGATVFESDLSGRLNADLEYLSGWSLWRDIWIMFATLKVLVHDKAF